MGQISVKKSQLAGEILIPPSKSHTLRAILFGAMGKGKSLIKNCPPFDGTLSMIEACRNFGALISPYEDYIEIEGIGGKVTQTENIIDAGNSGIILRFCTALSALGAKYAVITGDDSIRSQRPIKPLVDALQQLGVTISTMREDEYAPVIVKGPIKSGKTVVEGSDSQPVSALLIASAFAEGPIEIFVKNPGEKPWVDLTLNWFDFLGIPYTNHSYEYYSVPGKASFNGFTYHVPGDFSSAAFPIAAALVTNSELVLKNVNMKDCQGDKELIYALQNMGANIEIHEHDQTLRVRKGGTLKGKVIDINNFIDAVTTLAVLGCFAEGETKIINAGIARSKECDRLHCIYKELKKMGADIEEREEGLIIRPSKLKGAHVKGYKDHRMVMSLAVAGLGAEEGETWIDSSESIQKTFPTFIKDFRCLGAHIQEHP
ncbi:3-phosphoshikimate 1-carboxyvinyltransferase [Candidatus Protochlamydia phocaeensis]|uniref:3-phosphoshikimate 1-carboxyvinyltransferase n=1 Tax=Candidatus Protochlamydia phocaeensis TaxID=1414722 RepID=UPI000838659C|nr:3-phosphoshikimate 1-carboxyvinyltransferase [Candidatus Protochlamydia phocaeensis]